MPDSRPQTGAADAVEKVRAAEQMLERYIQQGKKPLAELALQTLLELAPEHPRRGDYRQWVAEIDQDVANKARIETALDRVRAAIAVGDEARARAAVRGLAKIDADAAADVEGELAEIERSRAENESIESRKRQIEALLEVGEVNSAEEEIDALSRSAVPKVTLDFLRRRLADRRAELRSQAELQSLQSVFDQHLAQRRWRSARDVARVVVEQFGDAEGASQMLARVDRRETEERRRRSVAQGIATLEGFLESGERQQAELALRVLRGLDLDEQSLAQYRQRLEQI